MYNKANTDIDRKLAIYYHPLYQEILNFVGMLFGEQNNLSLGLLEFLEFNLKLQKCLLPTFYLENAIVSGLNDWVKYVAYCLSFEGMVSTAGCTEVTPYNILYLLTKEIKSSKLRLLFYENEYRQFLKPFFSHDAFKLLGVRINSYVFSKFLFDLCTTWCYFLDVEIFVYFLLTLGLQISYGSSLTSSMFKHTKTIRTVELEFFYDFYAMKAEYNKSKRKELRYYRAWCEWNYLRMNQIGYKVILGLNEIFNGDERIQSLTELFEKAIDTINVYITNQIKDAPAQQKKTDSTQKEFLVFKKLDIKKEPIPEQFSFIKSEEPMAEPEIPHEFYISIDYKGNLYLKPIVKIPIIGVKIRPLPPSLKENIRREYFNRKKEEYREMSNLYRMGQFQQAVPHNPKTGPYYYEKSDTLKKIEKFYREKGVVPNRVIEIHRKKPVEKYIYKSRPISLYESTKEKVKLPYYEFTHKVMAPSFLTNNSNNISYVAPQEYGKEVGAYRRNLELNLPKNIRRDILIDKPVSIVGRLMNDRRKIQAKVASTDTSVRSVNRSLYEYPSLTQLKYENRHIWNRYVSEDEMRVLTDFNYFYEKLYKFRKMFADYFKSDYVKMINIDLEYEDTRYEMGGVITKEDKEKFSVRMAKLIRKDERRQRRRKRKRGFVTHIPNLRKFRSDEGRELFNHVFIDYHKEEIRRTKEPIVI